MAGLKTTFVWSVPHRNVPISTASNAPMIISTLPVRCCPRRATSPKLEALWKADFWGWPI